MSLILAEGFDVYGYSTNNWFVDSRWSRYSTATSLIGTTGRNSSGGYLALSYYNKLISSSSYYTHLTLGAAYSTLFLGFAYRPDSGVDTPTDPIFVFQKGTTIPGDVQFSIYRTSAHALYIKSGLTGSTLGTSADYVITPDIYQYVEIKAICDGSSGSVIIKINDNEVLNVSGNTKGAGSGDYSVIDFRNYEDNIGKLTKVDDLLVYDDQGSSFNDFVGDAMVLGNLPAADGSDSDWTSTQPDHYDSIDDVGNGFNTDYIEDATVNHQDCFTFTPAGTYPSILGVEVAAHGLNTGGGTAKITPYVRIGGVVYYGDELTLPAGSSDKRSYVWETNPATGTLWSKSVVAAAEWGFEVTEIS